MLKKLLHSLKVSVFARIVAYILFAAFVSPLLVWGINTVSEGYHITSAPQTIDAHGTCRVVAATGSNEYFVPTNTSTEWNSFLNNAPADVSINNCSSTTAGNGCKIRYKIKFGTQETTWSETPWGTNANVWQDGPWNTYLGSPADDMQVMMGIMCDADSGFGLRYRFRANQGPYPNNSTTYAADVYSSSTANVWQDGAWTALPSGTCYVSGGDGVCEAMVYDLDSWGAVQCTSRIQYSVTGTRTDDKWGYGNVIYNRQSTSGQVCSGAGCGIRVGIKCYDVPTVTVKDNANCGGDYSSIRNNYGGRYNAPYSTNLYATAALKSDGSIVAWGDSATGGSGAPAGSGYVKIYPSANAFAALKSDGSIVAWGDAGGGGTGAPTGTGFVDISSTSYPATCDKYTCTYKGAFAALKSDGSIVAWGDTNYGGSGAPTSTGFTKIYSNEGAFAALKSDGSIVAWGDAGSGGTGAPTGTGFTEIASTKRAFAALKSDGTIVAWGDSASGGSGAPTGNSFVKIYSNQRAFAALRSDGSIKVWGDSATGGSGAPTDKGYVKINSTPLAFAALKSDGTISAWGDSNYGGSGAPTDSGYVEIYANDNAFAALKSDGSIFAWGNSNYGGSGAPTGTGYVSIAATGAAFAALKSDGTISVWGDSATGGSGAPTDSGYVKIYSTSSGILTGAFTAIKSDGTLVSWGKLDNNNSSLPSGTGFVNVVSGSNACPYDL